MNMTIFNTVSIDSLIQSGFVVLAGIVAVVLAAWGSWLIVRKLLPWVAMSLDTRRFDKVYAKFQRGEELTDKENDILWKGSEEV